MIRTSIFFWLSLALLALFVSTTSARAECPWQVSTVLETEASGFNAERTS